MVSVLGRCSRLLERVLQRELESFGLGLGEFRVVGLLMGEPDGLSQAELSDRLGVTAPSLSVAVRQLERNGVVERRSDSSDARIKRVVLRSRARTAPVEHMLAELNSRLTGNLSKRDVEIARRVLWEVAGVLREELEGA